MNRSHPHSEVSAGPRGAGPLILSEIDPGALDRIADHLGAGGLLAYPTETTYGLGAATTVKGTECLQSLKGGRREAPFLVLLPSVGAPELAPARWGLELPKPALEAASQLWPGPLTMVLFDPEAHFPPGIRNESGGVAVRVSSHPFVEALMTRWARPLISTSANCSGSTTARSAGEIRTAFEAASRLQRLWIVDAGSLPESLPSTVVDFTGPRPRLLREGALTISELARCIPGLIR
jgi:L-threonylcarbamoyladenylate synthase